MNNKYGYLAFISYRHMDNVESGREWATWLHKELETYEIPSELVGTLNDRGEVIPEKIYPVFRDELELPASSDLSNSITTALDKTNVLVVLCSPNSAKSKYVGQEISYFKQIGYEDKIIAAIIDGEPNVSIDASKLSHGYSIDDECFHKALQFDYIASTGESINSREPIAADLRIKNEGKYQQGWTNDKSYSKCLSSQGILRNEIAQKVEEYKKQRYLMLLKIVAAILGINLNRLTKRDEEYQLKKLQSQKAALKRWIAAIAIVAIIALFSAYFAYRNQVVADAASINAKYNIGVAFSSSAESATKNNNYIDAAIYSAKAISNISGNSEEKLNLYELFRYSKQENRIQWRIYPNKTDPDIYSIDLSYDGKYSFTLVHRKILVKEYESNNIIKEINLRASNCNDAELIKVGNKLRNIILYDMHSARICIIKFNEDNGAIIENAKHTELYRYYGGGAQDIELSPDESSFLFIDKNIGFLRKSSLYVYDSLNMKMLFHDEKSWSYREKPIIIKQALYVDNSRIIINRSDTKGVALADFKNKKYDVYPTSQDVFSIGRDQGGHVFLISHFDVSRDKYKSETIAEVALYNLKLNIKKQFEIANNYYFDNESRLFFDPKSSRYSSYHYNDLNGEVEIRFSMLIDNNSKIKLEHPTIYKLISSELNDTVTLKNMVYSNDGSKLYLVYNKHIESILLPSKYNQTLRLTDNAGGKIVQSELTYDDKYLVYLTDKHQIIVRDAHNGSINKIIEGSQSEEITSCPVNSVFELGKNNNEIGYIDDDSNSRLIDIDSSKITYLNSWYYDSACAFRFYRNGRDVIKMVGYNKFNQVNVSQPMVDKLKSDLIEYPFFENPIDYDNQYEISNDGHYLAISNGYKFAIYNLETSKPANAHGGKIFDFDIIDSHDHIESFKFIYDNNLLVSSQDGLYILNVQDKSDFLKSAIYSSSDIPDLYQVSLNGAYLTYTIHGQIFIYSLKERKVISQLTNSYGKLTSIAINSTGSKVFITTISGDILAIDVSNKTHGFSKNDIKLYVNRANNKTIHVRAIKGKTIVTSGEKTGDGPDWLYENTTRIPDRWKIFIETNHHEVMLDEVSYDFYHPVHFDGNNIYYVTPDRDSKVFDVTTNKTLSTCKLISSLDEKDFFYYDSNFNHLVINDKLIADPIGCDVLFDLRTLELPILHHIPIYKQISDELLYLTKDNQLCVVHGKKITSCINLLDMLHEKFNKMTIAKNNDLIALSSDDSVALIDHYTKSSKLLAYYEKVRKVFFSVDSKYLFIHADGYIFVYNIINDDVIYFAKIALGNEDYDNIMFDAVTSTIITYSPHGIDTIDVSLYFDKSKPIDEKIDLWLQSVTQNLGLKFHGAKYMYDKRDENSHADHVDKYYLDF